MIAITLMQVRHEPTRAVHTDGSSAFTASSVLALSGEPSWLQDDCEEIRTSECPAGYAHIRAVEGNESVEGFELG